MLGKAPTKMRPQHTPHPEPRSRRDHIANQTLAPGPSSRAITAACATSPCPTSAASISPGSIRNPRTFTCASARPRNSSTPSPRQRARSPVRYIRLPGGTERVRNKPFRRQTRTPHIPPRKARPRNVKLTAHTGRYRLQTSVQNVGAIIGQGAADRQMRAWLLCVDSEADCIDRRFSRTVKVGEIRNEACREIVRCSSSGKASPPSTRWRNDAARGRSRRGSPKARECS